MRGRAAAAALISAVFALPLVFLLLGALRSPGAPPPTGLEVLAPSLVTDAFERAFALVPLGRQLANSLLVAVLAVPLTVLVASWAGFAATQLGPLGRRLIVGGSLLALVVPLSALWVPRFVLFSELRLVDTYVPLVAPALAATSPLYVLLFFWSFSRLPRDLIDAARLEGLSTVGVWWRVAAPLARSTTFAVAALAFVFHWSNFVDPLLYLGDPDRFTAPLGLRQLRALDATDLPVVMAGALLVTIPALAAFGLAHRRFLGETRAAGWRRR